MTKKKKGQFDEVLDKDLGMRPLKTAFDVFKEEADRVEGWRQYVQVLSVDDRRELLRQLLYAIPYADVVHVQHGIASNWLFRPLPKVEP